MVGRARRRLQGLSQAMVRDHTGQVDFSQLADRAPLLRSCGVTEVGNTVFVLVCPARGRATPATYSGPDRAGIEVVLTVDGTVQELFVLRVWSHQEWPIWLSVSADTE